MTTMKSFLVSKLKNLQKKLKSFAFYSVLITRHVVKVPSGISGADLRGGGGGGGRMLSPLSGIRPPADPKGPLWYFLRNPFLADGP